MKLSLVFYPVEGRDRGGAIVGLIIRRRHESGEGLIFLIAPICRVEEISIVSFISFIFSLERKKMSWMGQMWRCEAEGWGLAWPGPGRYNLLCVRCSVCAGHRTTVLQ